MRIAFAAAYDPRDVGNWSGSPSFMIRALEEVGATVDVVGPLPEHRPLLQMGRKVAHRAVGRRHLPDRDPRVLAQWAQELEQRLAGSAADAILSPSTTPVSHLRSERPIVVWTDATFGALVGFYPEFSNLSRSSVRNGRRQEEAALARVDLAVFSSQWAADGARDAYGVSEDRLEVVPFGANIEAPPAAEVTARIEARTQDRCRIVFIASDWFRKGGDVAVEAVGLLNEAGVPAEITLIGAQPPRGEKLPAYARYLGSVDKRSATGADRIGDLIGDAHFLLLPTRADCTPVVFAEASAWGTPSIAPDVGGVGEMVVDGANGRLLECPAGPEEYASAMSAAFRDPAGYRELALSSRREYDRRLNWTTAGKTVVRLIADVMAKPAKPAGSGRAAAGTSS